MTRRHLSLTVKAIDGDGKDFTANIALDRQAETDELRAQLNLTSPFEVQRGGSLWVTFPEESLIEIAKAVAFMQGDE